MRALRYLGHQPTHAEPDPEPRLYPTYLFDKVCRGCYAVKTVLAKFYEKYEEDAPIKQARCQKNLEKRRKISCVFSKWTYNKYLLTMMYVRNGNPNQNPYSWRGRSELTCSVPCWHTTIRCLVPPPQVVEHCNTTKVSFFYRHCLQL